MPKPERVLEILSKRNLKVTVTQDDGELCEINSAGKNVDVVIKNPDEFKKLIKELRG